MHIRRLSRLARVVAPVAFVAACPSMGGIDGEFLPDEGEPTDGFIDFGDEEPRRGACIEVETGWPAGPTVSLVDGEISAGTIAPPTRSVLVVDRGLSTEVTGPARLIRVSPRGTLAVVGDSVVPYLDPAVTLYTRDGDAIAVRWADYGDEERFLYSARFTERDGLERFDVLWGEGFGSLVTRETLDVDDSSSLERLISGAPFASAVSTNDAGGVRGFFLPPNGTFSESPVSYLEIDDACRPLARFTRDEIPDVPWLVVATRRDGEPEAVGIGNSMVAVGRPQLPTWTRLPGPSGVAQAPDVAHFADNDLALSYYFFNSFAEPDRYLMVRRGSSFSAYGISTTFPVCSEAVDHPACDGNVAYATSTAALEGSDDSAWWLVATTYYMENTQDPCVGGLITHTQLRLFEIDADGVREHLVPGDFSRADSVSVAPDVVDGQVHLAVLHDGQRSGPACDPMLYYLERLTVALPVE